MAEQPVTRSEAKEIVDEAVDKLAEVINSGFTHQQEQIYEIKETQAEHGKLLSRH